MYEIFAKALHAIHPTKSETNKQGYAVLYMRFFPYWFAVGLSTPDVKEWQYRQMLDKFATAIVWA